MNVLRALYPDSEAVKDSQFVVMWLTAIVSFFTALVGFPLFPMIADAIQGLELNRDGKFQHTGSYLIEVVDLIKESILVLSDDLVVLKCNDVSKVLFGSNIVGSDICQYIHPVDLPLLIRGCRYTWQLAAPRGSWEESCSPCQRWHCQPAPCSCRWSGQGAGGG